jgi:hypothetical protein
MEESNDVSKISLMIAYKQYVLFGKRLYVFRATDLEFIDDGKTRVSEYPYEGIYQLPHQLNIFKFINHNWIFKIRNIQLRLSICGDLIQPFTKPV